MSLKKGVKQLWLEAMAEVETIDAATAMALHAWKEVGGEIVGKPPR